MGPEPIPAGVCPPDQPDKKYLGSSGYRLIPGNTCDREAGIKKDEKVEKDCANGMSEMALDMVISIADGGLAKPAEGEIVHQIVRPSVACSACTSG